MLSKQIAEHQGELKKRKYFINEGSKQSANEDGVLCETVIDLNFHGIMLKTKKDLGQRDLLKLLCSCGIKVGDVIYKIGIDFIINDSGNVEYVDNRNVFPNLDPLLVVEILLLYTYIYIYTYYVTYFIRYVHAISIDVAECTFVFVCEFYSYLITV